eukprot:TRINITY_DN949_c0_g1_i1.p1 TRINITY_DN949_c0_g1~~TRINITY_DN949_c0_g1_i1.p1  ORF type:complete len:543 (-),score=97.00 TRINITY_DN949_c0_g1_i1:17-1645(-)
MEMDSLDGRPNCLILDELDGCFSAQGKGPIEILVKSIVAEPKKTEKFEEGQIEKKKKKKKKKKTNHINIRRPIICICNDMYVPALRKLREVVEIYRISPPDTARLVGRLAEICQMEGFQIDSSCLVLLCQLSTNDIRTCINTLQFLVKGRGIFKGLTKEDVEKAVVGRKDEGQDYFQIWNQIFHKNQKLQRTASSFSSSSSTFSQYEQLFRALSLQDKSQLDRILEGCHHNYLSNRSYDLSFNRVTNCLEWLVSSDMLSGSRSSYAETALGGKYLSTPIVAFHCLCSYPGKPTINFPTEAIKFGSETRNIKSIITSLNHYMTPTATHIYSSERTLVLDVLPEVIRILTPSLRSVNWQLLSKSEKEEVNKLVNILIGFHISYHLPTMSSKKQNDTSQTGDDTAIYDPAIDQVVFFSLFKTQFKHLPRVQRLLITKQIEVEIERRKSKLKADKSSASSSGPVKPVPPRTKEVVGSKVVTPIKITPKAQRDFFGRLRSSPKESRKVVPANIESNQDEKQAVQVVFKFQEGFTNGVKRNVFMKDFL